MPPNQKTLFVVGAGASSEVGLPVGSKLKDNIVDVLSFNPEERGISDAIIGRALDIEYKSFSSQYIQACKRICEAMPQVISIDNFIDQVRGDEQIERCGKLAIVRTILTAESGSSMFINPSNIHNKMEFKKNYSYSELKPLDETWFNRFWKLLTENCTVDDLEERFSKVAFIIFNYDRCIEHFLYHSLMNVYRMVGQTASKLVNSIEIHHPYGTVGSLPWQNKDNLIEYGGKPTSAQLLELAEQIKTFTEGAASGDMENIRSLMLSSSKIAFLGFAFNKRNMELLFSETSAKPTAKLICGTALNLSEDSHETLRVNLPHGNKVSPILLNNPCSEFFHKLERKLSFV